MRQLMVGALIGTSALGFMLHRVIKKTQIEKTARIESPPQTSKIASAGKSSKAHKANLFG
jgi:hypothetical protein